MGTNSAAEPAVPAGCDHQSYTDGYQAGFEQCRAEFVAQLRILLPLAGVAARDPNQTRRPFRIVG